MSLIDTATNLALTNTQRDELVKAAQNLAKMTDGITTILALDEAARRLNVHMGDGARPNGEQRVTTVKATHHAAQPPKTAAIVKRKSFTPEAKKRMAAGMKKYWKKRRAAGLSRTGSLAATLARSAAKTPKPIRQPAGD